MRLFRMHNLQRGAGRGSIMQKVAHGVFGSVRARAASEVDDSAQGRFTLLDGHLAEVTGQSGFEADACELN